MFWIEDNRIVISALFALGAFLFLILFLDSHYKALFEYKNSLTKKK